MEPKPQDSAGIQAKVLQNTLDEVASRNKSADNVQLECCVICLEGITEACEARPCQHTNFDFVCLINWLEQQPKCPLCKISITEVRYDHEEPARERWKTFVPETKEVTAAVTAPANTRRPRPPRRNWPYYRPSRRREYTSPVRTITEDEAVSRRREIYRDRLYSLHVGTNRITQYQELTPQLFEQDPGLVSRARMWLRRELKVFEFLHTPVPVQGGDDVMTRRRANNAEFLLEYIIAILKTVDIQGSQGQAEDMLQEFLGRDNTRLLLHELRSFLKSPYMSLEAWDRAVQYRSASPAKQGEDTPGENSQPESSSTTPILRPAADDINGFRFRGDSYRPQYNDSDNQHVGSARRPRPR
ncbi:RING finger domain protein [Seiridium cupressi]